MELSFPRQGRVAGLDFGTVRVGIAVCDPQRRLASPHATYTRRSAQADAEFFRQFAAGQEIGGFVVGLPVHTDGAESQKSIEARRFGAWLTQATGLPVVFQDERFTTVEADELLRGAKAGRRAGRQRRDMLAAQLILAAYLEAPHAAGQSPGPLEDRPPPGAADHAGDRDSEKSG